MESGQSEPVLDTLTAIASGIVGGVATGGISVLASLVDVIRGTYEAEAQAEDPGAAGVDALPAGESPVGGNTAGPRPSTAGTPDAGAASSGSSVIPWVLALGALGFGGALLVRALQKRR